MSMGANLYHHFHQRTVGTPDSPSSQMAERQYARMLGELVSNGVPAEQVLDAAMNEDRDQIETWMTDLLSQQHPDILLKLQASFQTYTTYPPGQNSKGATTTSWDHYLKDFLLDLRYAVPDELDHLASKWGLTVDDLRSIIP